MERHVCWIHQYILNRLIFQEYKVAVSEAKEIKLGKLLDKVTGIVRGDPTFVDIMRRILNMTVAFEKEQNKKFVATRIVDILQ